MSFLYVNLGKVLHPLRMQMWHFTSLHFTFFIFYRPLGIEVTDFLKCIIFFLRSNGHCVSSKDLKISDFFTLFGLLLTHVTSALSFLLSLFKKRREKALMQVRRGTWIDETSELIIYSIDHSTFSSCCNEEHCAHDYNIFCLLKHTDPPTLFSFLFSFFFIFCSSSVLVYLADIRAPLAAFLYSLLIFQLQIFKIF